MAAAADWKFDGPRLVRHGITLAAVPARDDRRQDIPVPDAQAGLGRLSAALDILMTKSAFAADALATLKQNGRVVIVYDPAFPEKTVGAFTVAAFRPTYFKRRRADGDKAEFVAVIGRYGIKWSPRELAGVIGHELIGHGLQFLRRRHGSMRELERECEARLYQERINQDVGVDKRTAMTIKLRKSMEDKYCAGFKRFLRQKSPALDKLWDRINPDVPRLLTLFEAYLVELKRSGAAKSAIAAEKQMRIGSLRTAAVAGDANAQYRLGTLHARGGIVARNPELAAKWTEKAAKQGHPRAQNRFGAILQYGRGRPKDDIQALVWYRKAARLELPEAETNLGHMLERGRGVKIDLAAALKYYRRAAGRGFARAQHNLAIMYDKGRGVARDPAKALVWLRRAAKQNYAPSETSLGYAYQNGRGLAPDHAQAAKFYRRASERGHAVAQYLLARLYDRGNGVARDPAKAYFWYGLAGKRGAGNMASRARNARNRLKGAIGKIQSARIDARIGTWRPLAEAR